MATINQWRTAIKNATDAQRIVWIAYGDNYIGQFMDGFSFLVGTNVIKVFRYGRTIERLSGLDLTVERAKIANSIATYDKTEDMAALYALLTG